MSCVLEGAGRVQIAGQEVVERGDVGRALDGGVAAQGQDAAAGPADVAQQELQDRGRADHLHAGRVLRPADRVADGRRCGPGPRRWPERLGDLQERLARRAADLLDHLRRVAGVVPAEDLEDAARVLQGRVGARRPGQLADPGAEGRGVVELAHRLVAGPLARLGVVAPGRRVVLLALGVEAGEEAGEVLGVLELLGDQGRGVGVGDEVVAGRTVCSSRT